MAMPVANSVPLTGNPLIDGLTQGGSWQIPGPRVLTYSFSLNTEPTDPVWGSYPALRTAVEAALATWSAVANITFVESGSGTDIRQSAADIAIALEDSPGVAFAGLGVFPDPAWANTFLPLIDETRASFPRPEGDIDLNVGFPPVRDATEAGGYGRWIAIHELGHALGLKHTNDDGGNGRPTFAALGLSGLDSTQYTVMSYNGPAPLLTGHPATPMPLDILAIQQIYGANMSYRTGNDEYTLGYDRVLRTIWDAGGIDTFDVSSESGGVTIDLREGHFSMFNGANHGQVAIAYGTVIEKAIGGSGYDTLIGNDADNTLDGGAGNDTIQGGGGSDTLIGGPGDDVLDGGTGVDTMTGGAGNDKYYVDVAADVIVELDGGGYDVVYSTAPTYVLSANVEELRLLGAGNLQGTGNAGDNLIYGNAGANVLDGDAGMDRLAGGAGDDTYIIHAGDTLPATFLQLDGQPGDYISGGNAFLLRQVGYAQLQDLNSDGFPDTVVLNFFSIDLGSEWTLNFSTRNTGAAFGIGTYTGAERAAFASPGHAGLDITGQGRGSNTVAGQFTITDFSYSGTTLLTLGVTFEQHSEGATPALFGTVHYNLASSAPADTIVELPDGGIDTVLSAMTYTLGANLENLTLTGTDDINGTGNDLDNAILGNTGINVLAGGKGNDTYGVDNAGDTVVENPGEGIDTVRSSVSYALAANVENLTLTGASNINGTGNALDNVILGNSGVNVLTGGLGNDTYGVDNAGDTVVENPGEGADTVRSSISYTLSANLENLILTGTQDLAGTGNAADNVIRGNVGNNVLTGGGGNDTLLGGGGKDTVMLAQAKSAYAMHYAHGLLTLTSATDTTTVGTVETLRFADTQEQSVATFFLAKSRDFDGDGHADILWRNVDDGRVSSWLMDGLTVTTGAVFSDVPLAWQIQGRGDFNGDGSADMLWRNVSDGRVSAWLMDGLTVLEGEVFSNVPLEWQIQGTADFDGDGNSDILWRNVSDGRVSAWLMDGLTVTEGTVFGDVPREWQIQGTADFDGDGSGDILWRNVQDGRVSAWLMDGLNVKTGAVFNDVPLAWKISGTGDFDGDGRSDILWRNQEDGQVSVWLMDGLALKLGDVFSDVPLEWQIQGTGDFNNDQRADILWRSTEGAVSQWLMDGLTVLEGSVFSNVPKDWVIFG